MIARRKTKSIYVGSVGVGSNFPVSIQTMTNSATTDIDGSLKQIYDAKDAGADLIRVSCPDFDSVKAFEKIAAQSPLDLIADIHFDYRIALEVADKGAKCLRINPGNIGKKERVMEVVKAAKANNCSIRIGVNAGSLEKSLLQEYNYVVTPEVMLRSAQNHIKILEDLNFDNFKISVKASNVILAINSYKLLAANCDYPLHLGITESGGLMNGSIKSAIGIGNLLLNGIGDTIRVSLSADIKEEIKTGLTILRSLELRDDGIRIIACPSCARQGFNVIDTVKEIESKLQYIKNRIVISIIGCVVNGPGEARNADIAITGGGNNKHVLYKQGKQFKRIDTKDLVTEVVALATELNTNINANKIARQN